MPQGPPPAPTAAATFSAEERAKPSARCRRRWQPAIGAIATGIAAIPGTAAPRRRSAHLMTLSDCAHSSPASGMIGCGRAPESHDQSARPYASAGPSSMQTGHQRFRRATICSAPPPCLTNEARASAALRAAPDRCVRTTSAPVRANHSPACPGTLSHLPGALQSKSPRNHHSSVLHLAHQAIRVARPPARPLARHHRSRKSTTTTTTTVLGPQSVL